MTVKPTKCGATRMIAFDSTGAIRWSVPGYTPKIATADGGVIATDASGSAAMFDENGRAVGQMGKFLTQSWIGNTYRIGSTVRELFMPTALATSFAAAFDRPAAKPLPDRVRAVYDVVAPDPLGGGAVLRSIAYRAYQGKTPVTGPASGAVIEERLLYSYGQQPQQKGPSPSGGDFEDQVGTRGSGSFGLTQQFYVTAPAYARYRVQIEPCIADVTIGPRRWENLNIVTSQTVLISGDAGSTIGRSCVNAQ